jgi:hypothetical protein
MRVNVGGGQEASRRARAAAGPRGGAGAARAASAALRVGSAGDAPAGDRRAARPPCSAPRATEACAPRIRHTNQSARARVRHTGVARAANGARSPATRSAAPASPPPGEARCEAYKGPPGSRSDRRARRTAPRRRGAAGGAPGPGARAARRQRAPAPRTAPAAPAPAASPPTRRPRAARPAGAHPPQPEAMSALHRGGGGSAAHLPQFLAAAIDASKFPEHPIEPRTAKRNIQVGASRSAAPVQGACVRVRACGSRGAPQRRAMASAAPTTRRAPPSPGAAQPGRDAAPQPGWEEGEPGRPQLSAWQLPAPSSW